MGFSGEKSDLDLIESSGNITERPSPRKKWWHVPDKNINELLHSMVEDGTASTSSSPTSRVGRPLGPSGIALPCNGIEAVEGTLKPSLSNRLPRREGQKTVRFEHEDAVDKMVREMALHRGSEADILEDSPWEVAQEHNVGASAPKPMTKGGWKVSDAELMQHIMHTAEHVKSESNFRSSFTSFAFAGQALVHPSMLRSASVPSGASSSPADAEPIIVRNKKSAITSSNERLSITINFLDSGDTLVMKVMTSLRVGPATPPKLNPFTELFGAGASTKGFCELKKGFDYQKRQFGTTQRPGWRPEWKESLKEMLAHLTGLDISRLRLYHKNCLMSDELPLSAYGIRNGETFTLMILKEREAHTVGRDITLCSSVKASKTTWEERREQLLAGAIPGHLYSLRQSKHLKECGPGSDVLMMPRWVSQVDPQLFAPVASGITGDGSMKCRVNFNEVPIYMPDMRDPKFIGVRQRISDKKCYTTNYVPLC